MSDKKPAKRGYRMEHGAALSYDLRVRITGDMEKALKQYAMKHNTTRAAAARSILQAALMKPEK